MGKFDVPLAIEPLREAYPPAEAIIRAIREGDREARYAMARMWLSEGIPFSFRERPGLYDSVRRWLSVRLRVQAKEITLVGSGRQGFCLSPGVNLGRVFGEYSDLDFTAISTPLFENLAAAVERWIADYAAGFVVPRNEREKQFWDDNYRRLPSNVARGFIDAHKIPYWNRYPEAQRVGQTLSIAIKKLKSSRMAPKVHRLSLRAYRNWDSFIRQMAISLEAIALYIRDVAPGQ